MKIQRLHILSVLFVLTGIWAAVLLYSDGSIERKEESSKIAVDTTVRITQVKFGAAGKQNVLRREGRRWVINSKYEVEPRLAKVTLVALARMEVKHPVAADNKASVVQLLKKSGIHVEVINVERKYAFTLYANPNDPTSTYYLQEGSNEPMIVHVPGVSGNLVTLFALGEVDWRVKYIFPGEIPDYTGISVQYPEDPQESFSISAKKGAFTIRGIDQLDSMRFYTYIANYQQARVDNYITPVGIPELELLSKQPADAKILVTNVSSSRNRTIRFYLKQEIKGVNGVPIYIEETGEWAVLSPRAASKLVVPKSFFVVGKINP